MYSIHTFNYGPHLSQEADLYLPDLSTPPPVVCLLHGGFWRMPYGREEFEPVAVDLVSKGFAVWNIEYRRLGSPGGGWPGTFEDASSAINHLATVKAEGISLDLDRVIVAGHSAGGHLALWAIAAAKASLHSSPDRVRPVAVAGLAAVTDLARAFSLNAGMGAVAELLGGSPTQFPDRYAATSPIEMLPLQVRQLIIHGGQDNALSIDLSRSYAASAQAAGDCVEFIELPDAGHMDYLNPASKAHTTLCNWLASSFSG